METHSERSRSLNNPEDFNNEQVLNTDRNSSQNIASAIYREVLQRSKSRKDSSSRARTQQNNKSPSLKTKQWSQKFMENYHQSNLLHRSKSSILEPK